MKYNKQCECCGHLVTAYSHALNAPLVQALEQLVDFYHKRGIGAHLQKDLNLTKNQYNNFQKLQYFDLVLNTYDGWIPSSLAFRFLRGDSAVMNPVATFGKEVLNPYHRAWLTAEKRPVPTHISAIKNYEWKGREVYKEEKRITLFN